MSDPNVSQPPSGTFNFPPVSVVQFDEAGNAFYQDANGCRYYTQFPVRMASCSPPCTSINSVFSAPEFAAWATWDADPNCRSFALGECLCFLRNKY